MLIVVVFIRANAGGTADYISVIKQENGMMTQREESILDENKARLRAAILTEAESRSIKPIDARIDRVWKAIPGYNGLEVDVEGTVEKTIASGSLSPILYVYKEMPPRIKLADLGPLPVYKGNPNKKMISLMINVAWGNEYITPILQTLNKEEVKATFFLDGSWLKKYPEIAKQIQAEGHEMSNHAYTHPKMSELSRNAASLQISRTEDLLKSTLGVTNKWFAPPSGDFNQMTVQVAAEQRLRTVLWTIDTVDWTKPGADWIIRRISSRLEPGALILMHPTASSRDALTGMIREIKRQGYVLGTVSETLSEARIPAAVEPQP
ncbi:probable sporulation protein, polysaccharide deacetylase family [Paenibacillus algorifonticola]|uniref:Probable sporulation protein, polysaccharide deacetylase family n=1 Tax=Paenibacillus algorifonticola TaxID=684063 RepID=A0A1I1YCW8_9BACL|nr:probable sporulation protein, polysaccharide deacetylase family [Paenibacillus algorifonticola]